MKNLTALFALAAASAFAEVKLNGIFSDHMVLQRDRAVPVWGTAAPGESVTVSFGGHGGLSAKADAKGRWEVKLPAMKWSAAAQELVGEAKLRKDGKYTLEFYAPQPEYIENAENNLNSVLDNVSLEYSRKIPGLMIIVK